MKGNHLTVDRVTKIFRDENEKFIKLIKPDLAKRTRAFEYLIDRGFNHKEIKFVTNIDGSQYLSAKQVYAEDVLRVVSDCFDRIEFLEKQNEKLKSCFDGMVKIREEIT